MRPNAALADVESNLFQSTHPHGVRPCRPQSDYRWQSVSIHAPAWGATQQQVEYWEFAPVSIHAPAWGATWHAHNRRGWKGRFNPRTRMGCDVVTLVLCPHIVVSIHAPAWGATNIFFQIVRIINVSIHAPAWGATKRQQRRQNVSKCFNPRTRMGCDDTSYQIIVMPTCVSIHAPAWGATFGIMAI